MLGKARRAIVTKDDTTIVAEGNEEAVKARIEQIRRQIQEVESSYDIEETGYWGASRVRREVQSLGDTALRRFPPL